MSYSGTNTQDSSDEATFKKTTPSKSNFKFPPPPRVCVSEGIPYLTPSSHSDSSNSDYASYSTKKRNKSILKRLPPLGIFWDIENCQVPKSKSAAAVVQRLREIFLENHRESEFIVVCDVKKENPQIIQELHDSQVNLIHVSSTSKNAADEKLRQSLRRFAELHTAPASVVLVSGDINFAADLSDLRYRKKIRVFLVHNVNVADALILCANEHYFFSSICESLPETKTRAVQVEPTYLMISNLNTEVDAKRIKNRLKILVDNCGGRVVEILQDVGLAYVKFSNLDTARRAQRRIQGEDVFGNKIKVLPPSSRSYAGRKIKSSDCSFQSTPGGNYQMPPPGFSTQDYQKYAYDQYRRTNSQERSQYGGIFRPIRNNSSMINNSHLNNSHSNNSAIPMEVGGGYDNVWNNLVPPQIRRGGNSDRRPTTPQDLACGGFSSGSSQTGGGRSPRELSDEGKLFYQTNQDSSTNRSASVGSNNQPVDLIISNLDSTIDVKELRRLLTNMLKEYVMILSLNISIQADGSPVANIRVNSQTEAQFAISQLHRQKLGHKRIIISYAQSNSPDPDQLRAMVIGLLQEAPEQCMPLFKFIELLESRYHCAVSVSEVNKLKDICKITDDLGSRIIALTHEVKASPPLNLSGTLLPYCTIHCPNGLQSRGWGELNTIQTPNIIMSLKVFATQLNGLLSIHLGCMPLLSFQSCYEQEFHDMLPVEDSGVPLEHLISCVPNVEIKCVGPNKNIKIIKHELKSLESDDDGLKIMPSPLAPNISLLCRELVDLLKTTEKCQLLLSKFIPAYHHHFGRQCRVADYGYTKLLDLFESISHVVQIMGDGSRKLITLSHTAQMRRFTSDLLRVLKVQPAKQILLNEFPAAYEKVMNKTFNAVEYGLCFIEDLLQEVPEVTIVISKTEEGIIIAVPKREQTSEEVMRTKQFANEVIDLLRHAPYYNMLFNKFVPAYHHHFGHQCRVSDYGFTKLIELFEAIPEIVKIEELPDGERTVSLSLDQSLKILGTQLVQVIKSCKGTSIQLEDLPGVYLRECGYPLKPSVYECETISELVEKLQDHIQIVRSNAGTLIVAVDMDPRQAVHVRSWALLLNPPHCKDLATFKYEYQSRYNSTFSVGMLQSLHNVVTIKSNSSDQTSYIGLTALYVLAAQLYHVIFNNGGSVLYGNLEKLYYESYRKTVKLSNYNINTVDEFYDQFSLLFFIRGSKRKSYVVLNRNLADHLVPLPNFLYQNQQGGQFKSDWPPAPNPEMIQQTPLRKVSPPKPDTPPTPGNAPWNNWSMGGSYDNSLNLSIQMPIVHNPKLLGNPDSLISPARHLFPPAGTWSSVPSISAPDPADLPMPDKLIPSKNNGGQSSDDSTDSGVNTKLDNSHSDTEVEQNGASGLALAERRRFLGAKPHFATYLNFNN